MKKQDLMIGDWVRITPYDIIDQVDCLLTEYAVTSHGDSCGQYDYKDIEPIPLTPEILEKNVFSKPADAGDGTLICGMSIPPYKLTFQSIFGLPVITIEDVVDDDNLHTCLVLKDEIHFVHELQHALRLCGIEKEIVL